MNKSHIAMLQVPYPKLILLLAFFIHGCDQKDPKPVNEEEVITTVTVTLVPDQTGETVTLKFYDADGENGNIGPVISVSGSLKASATYAAVIELLNEAVDPAESISDEVAAEATDHLFCFETTENLTIDYLDEDENEMPLGLITSWATGSAGAAQVEILLRHQAGTKTGVCPGTGETDVQVAFEMMVE